MKNIIKHEVRLHAAIKRINKASLVQRNQYFTFNAVAFLRLKLRLPNNLRAASCNWLYSSVYYRAVDASLFILINSNASYMIADIF